MQYNNFAISEGDVIHSTYFLEVEGNINTAYWSNI